MTSEGLTLKAANEYALRMGTNTFALDYLAQRLDDEADDRTCTKLGIQDDPARHHPAAVCFRCSDGVEVGRPWWAEVRKGERMSNPGETA